MSVTLGIENFNSLNLQEVSRLDADVLVGGDTLALETAQNIGANNYVVIGILTSENSELKQIDAVTGNSALLTTVLAQPHGRFEPVTKLFGNKAKVYSAPNTNNLAPADSTFTAVGDGIIALDIDQDYTPFTDPAGSSDVWYKFTYFNSTTSLETSLSDSLAVRGGAVGNYCSLDDIRKEAGFKNNRYISNSDIDGKRQAAQSEINGALKGVYAIPFVAPINPFIVDLTARLAAGLLQTTQFGVYNTLNTNNGKEKLKEARAQLMQLKTSQTTLINEAGTDISLPTGGSVGGWPDETTNGTEAANAGDSGPGFRRSNRY